MFSLTLACILFQKRNISYLKTKLHNQHKNYGNQTTQVHSMPNIHMKLDLGNQNMEHYKSS